MKKIRFFSKESVPENKLFLYVILFVVLISQSSCFKQYYQTNTKPKADAITLEQLDSARKLFIVHTPTGPFSLKNIAINNESLSGDKTLLTTEYDEYLNPPEETGNAFARKQRWMVVNQVHLYTDSSYTGTNQVVLPISQIKRMDVYGLDKPAIKRDRTLSIIGISVLGAAIVTTIAIAEVNAGSYYY